MLKFLKAILEFFKRMVRPMIEDRRYVIFGLADKTTFTQEEYEALRKKYPNFDQTYDKWERYLRLIKKSDYISNLSKEKDNLYAEMSNLEDEASEIQNKLTRATKALEELADAQTFKEKVLADLINDKKKQLEDRLSEIDNRMAYIESRVKEIVKAIADYRDTVSSLRSQIEQEITEIGGTLPF